MDDTNSNDETKKPITEQLAELEPVLNWRIERSRCRGGRGKLA